MTDVGVPGILADWEQYTNPTLQSLLKTNQSIPNRIPLRYALIDLKTGTRACSGTHPEPFAAKSPGRRTVRLCFSPRHSCRSTANSPLGLSGNAAAELDVRSGQYQILPVDLTSRTVVSTEWLSPATVEIRSTNDLGVRHPS